MSPGADAAIEIRSSVREAISGTTRRWSTSSMGTAGAQRVGVRGRSHRQRRSTSIYAVSASSTLRVCVRCSEFQEASSQDGNCLKAIRGPDRSHGLVTIGAPPTGPALKGHTSTATGASSGRHLAARQQVKLAQDYSLSRFDVPARGERADEVKAKAALFENLVGEVPSCEKSLRSADAKA